MKHYKINCSVNEMLFFFAYGLYIFIGIMNISFFQIYTNNITKYINILCMLILLYNELLNKKICIKEIFLLLFVSLLAFPVTIHNNGTLFIMILFIYCARSIDFRKIAKFSLLESILLLFLVIFSSKIGIITNYISTEGGRIREYLGFRYALFSPMILFNITALELYLHKDKFSPFRYIILFILNYYVYIKTDSRLSFYLSILLILFIAILTRFPNFFKKRNVLCKIMVFSFILCSIFSLVTTINYDYSNPYMSKLNEILGRRLYLGHISLDMYPINLLGHDTKYIGNGLDMYGNKTSGTYFYVDCLYLNLLEKYGLIFTVILLLLLTYSLSNTLKEKDYFLLVILTFFALHGIIDDLEIYIYYNTFWFIISKNFSKYLKSNDYIERSKYEI